MSDTSTTADAVVLPIVPAARRGPVRRLYDWVLSWADSPRGAWALGVLSFAEASFFPIPPDVLLIALVLGRPDRWLSLATSCTLTSVGGGLAGYAIGVFFMDTLGVRILEFYGAMAKFETLKEAFQQVAFFTIFTAGLTPIPYKVFTIAAGACRIDLPVFVVASLFSRGVRFYAVSGLIRIFGPRVRDLIDRYFNLLTIVFTICLIGGFVLVKHALR